MSYSSEPTRARLLDSAREEFLRHGFIGANLRDIANRANVTTGALYVHFAGKEELFGALVDATATEFLERFAQAHRRVEGIEKTEVEGASNAETDWALSYIYAHADVFRLVVANSEGTKYVRYVESLVEIEESTHQRLLDPEVLDHVGTFFIHAVASSGIREMFAPLLQGLSQEEAEEYMDKLKQYHFGGWDAIVNTRKIEQ